MNSTLPGPVDYHESALADKKLLVVDDDGTMLTAVSKVLLYAGAEVESAGSVAEAIEIISGDSAPFDAILTELRLPDTSGLHILTAMKAAHPEVPVLIMSAFWTQETKQECSQLGAAHLLSKPLRSWNLLESIMKAMGNAHEAPLRPCLAADHSSLAPLRRRRRPVGPANEADDFSISGRCLASEQRVPGPRGRPVNSEGREALVSAPKGRQCGLIVLPHRC